MDDRALLNSYIESSSEQSFRELVERHVATVYSAARRQVGESLAADVTQAVFVVLARKARKLRTEVVLTAWLLTVTRMVSRATLRGEIRRRHREQEAVVMPPNYEQSELESAWQELEPLLDDALAAMPERDRCLVALRFFENKSHAEIATTLGLSEEASKKRLSRAVERLRAYFGRRGVAVGGSLLLTAIVQNSVQAAPAGLALQAATTAAAGGGANAAVAAMSKTTLKMLMWTKTKIAVLTTVVVLLAASVPLAINQPRPTEVKGPDGRVANLEEIHFQAGRVVYNIPPATALQRLASRLPKALGDQLRLSKPITAVVMPAFNGEPELSGVFSWEANTNHPEAGGLRLALADDAGNEFDPGVHDMMVQSKGGHQFWLGEAHAFPRRGKEVRLRVISENLLIAEYRIPNPAPGPHPVWHATALPSKATDGDLEGAMIEFRAIHPSLGNFSVEKYSHTECVLQFRESDQPTLAWSPVGFEIFDATGNHWKAYPNGRYMGTKGEAIKCGFLGGLWGGEMAWKIRVEVRRTGAAAGAGGSRFLEFLAKPEQVKE